MTQSSDHLQRRGNRIAVVDIVISVAVTIVIGVAGIVVDVLLDGNDTSGSAAGETETPAQVVAAPVRSSEEQPDPLVDPLTPGTCLSTDTAALPCDVSHLKEVYAVAPDCSSENLVAFLGGVKGRDVLRRDLTTGEQPDGACVVELPAGAAVTRSLQDVLSDGLTEDRSPWLRRCFDARSEQDVDCGSHHTGEYVWERQRDSLEPIDCTARAGEYLDTSTGRMSHELTLEDLSTNDTELCRISVKGSNSLEGSIRNLGFRSIPLGPS